MKRAQQVKPLLFLSLISSILLLSGCAENEQYVQDQINEANFCEIKEDCTPMPAKCPFGCNTYVHESRAEEIKILINTFKTNCVYDCFTCPDVDCIDNKCVPVCEQ